MARAPKQTKKAADTAKSGNGKNRQSPADTDAAAPDLAAGSHVGSVIPGASQSGQQKTVANMLGEMVWLLTMSPTHKHFALGDLEWLIMPPLMLQQYRIYYDGQRPVALALWAYLSPDAEAKLQDGGTRLRPDEWRTDAGNVIKDIAAQGQGATLETQADGASAPQGALWLVDLIAPEATPENKLAEKVLTDLTENIFKGQTLKFHVTDPQTGKRIVKQVTTPA